jgi:hypothetical protein
MSSSGNLKIIDRWKHKKDDPEIQEAFKIATIGPGTSILLLDDSIDMPNHYGLFLPKRLYRYSGHLWDEVFRSAMRYDYDYSLGCEYYIAISGRVNRIRKEYPAFFMYVCAHEMGHARIFLSNPELHIFSSLLESFFKEASGTININPWEYPHEKRCDQFGLSVASEIYSHDTLKAEIPQLMNSRIFNADNLEPLLLLPHRDNFDGLHDELIHFSISYKNELIALWIEDLRKCGNYSLVNEINDLEALFVHKSAS